MVKKKVIIFGAGERYLRYKDVIKSEYEVIGVCDNDYKKLELCKGAGDNTISPNEIGNLCQNDEDIYIYISTIPKYRYEIMKQLLGMGIKADKICFAMPDWMDRCESVEVVENGLKICINDVKILLTNETEEMICSEIFIMDDYNINMSSDSIVIDIGLNVGLASLFFAKKGYVKKVFGFEPDERVLEKALINISMNKDLENKIETFNLACSCENKKEIYTVHPIASAGIHKVREGEAGNTEVVTVNCVDSAETLGEIIDKYFEKTNIIVKCDCEGAEYEILPRLEETGYMRKIDAFVMEWHLDRRKEIEEFFERNGYIYMINTTRGRRFGKCYAIRK